MATMEEKMGALTKLMQDGILTAEEFACVVAALSGAPVSAPQKKEKTILEKQYEEVFSKYVINVFKSPASCKWPELESSMVKRGNLKIMGSVKNCTYIETYIDAPNSYGALLRKQLKVVIDSEGIITNVLEELQYSGVSLLGTIANAANKDNWHDIVSLPRDWRNKWSEQLAGNSIVASKSTSVPSNTRTSTSPVAAGTVHTKKEWTCVKCGEPNPVNSRICRGCGENR